MKKLRELLTDLWCFCSWAVGIAYFINYFVKEPSRGTWIEVIGMFMCGFGTLFLFWALPYLAIKKIKSKVNTAKGAN